MRTTIRIDDGLLEEAKKMAAESKTSLTSLIEDALREILSRKTRNKTNRVVKLTTFKGNGLQGGVDLDDSASLLGIMES
jgi:Arc/MetJ family transcription regulator